MRRTHLREHENILKRLIVHAAGFNLGLLLRSVIGIGKPRRLQDFPGLLFLLILWLAGLVQTARNVFRTLLRTFGRPPTPDATQRHHTTAISKWGVVQRAAKGAGAGVAGGGGLVKSFLEFVKNDRSALEGAVYGSRWHAAAVRVMGEGSLICWGRP